MNAFLHWIDDRTGFFTALGCRFDQRMPGGPGWRYILPGVLMFTFMLEALTGIFLWMFYSPSAQSAWESVFWIQYGMHGGWLLRGIHFYAGHTMVVLSGLYIVQLVFTGAYRAPREFIFWLSILMLFALLGLLLTGDLLRWDQEGYWSTQVRARFLTLIPWIGGEAFKVAVGGSDFGHLTLTRFFALHGGVCAVGFLVLLLWHNAIVRRHGLDGSNPWQRNVAGQYWPGQAVRNFLACAVVLAVVLYLVLHAAPGDHTGQMRGEYLGAKLGSPANPADAYAAARPEWAFLSLYQLTNVFPGEGIFGSSISWKFVPIYVITSSVVLLFFLMPFIAMWRKQILLIPLGHVSLGHVFNVALLVVVLAALAILSVMCIAHDRDNQSHQAALAAGHAESERAKELALAPAGIPPTGALTLLRNDAKLQGPKLFAQHCASCHPCVDPQGEGIKVEKPTAPNLYHFASRQWIAGILDPKRIKSADYFGNTKFASGKMAGFVKDTFADLDKETKEQVLGGVMALSAEAALKSQKDQDARDAKRIAEGRKSLVDDFSCTDCHRFRDKGPNGKAPDLTGYGSRDWLAGIISNPAHARFYGKTNDRMPAYAESADPAKNLLTPRQLEMLVEWLRAEWYERGK
jgi:ubiquinol-cytochrome c reductase cytochrome b subunit